MNTQAAAAQNELTVNELQRRSTLHLADIGRGAAEGERVRELPYGPIRQLAAAGLLTWRIPQSDGGARQHNFARHWRNPRTLANRNPRPWKAAVVGAWQLSGTEPPVSGLF